MAQALAHVQGVSTCGGEVKLTLKVTVFEKDLPRLPRLQEVVEFSYDEKDIQKIAVASNGASEDCLHFIAQYMMSKQREKTK